MTARFYKLFPVLVALCIISTRESTCGQELTNNLPFEKTERVDVLIPPRPMDHVLDNAHFLGSEARQSLVDLLAAHSREHGVNVFVLIVPSLPKNALETYTKQVTEIWTKDLFGGVVVFDDATGQVAIEKSEQVSKRFYEFELSVLLRDTMKPEKRPRLSRDGLVYTSKSIADALVKLKVRADDEDKQSFRRKAGLSIFLIILISSLVGVQFLRNGKGKENEENAIVGDTPTQ